MNSFYQNPFYLLGVTPRENRQRIIEMAEEKSLTLDSDICEKARSDLTNLRVRVSAEIAWLPGLSPKRTADLINILHVNPALILKQSGDLAKRLLELEQQAYELAGERFNLNSFKQVQTILFERLKLPSSKKIPWSQVSTTDGVLQQLALDYPLPRVILEYRELNKQNLPALVRANLLGAAFSRLDPAMSTDDWVQWMLDLAYAIEEIDLEDIMRDINEDRAIAKLTEIKSLSVLEDEFATHRRNYQEAVIAALNRLTTLKLVDIITQAIEVATAVGDQSAPSLLKDLIEGDYQSKTRKFIENEAENVIKFVELIRKSAPKGEETVTALLDRMESVLRKWDKIAQPIQVVMKSSGEEHDISRKLADEIRGLGVDLYNNHGMLNIVTRLTQILQEVFAELPEVVERLDQDSETLESLSVQREQEQRQKKWADDIAKILDALKNSASRKQSINTPIDQLSVMLRQGFKLEIPNELRTTLGYAIRSVGVDLFNEYDLLDEAQRITTMLQNAFADLPEVRKKINQDAIALKEIRDQREQAKRQEQEWRESITFKTELGTDTLSISPSGVRWKNISFTLEQVTRVRWGAVRNSINGIPSGTDYTICFGDNFRLATIVTQKEPVFDSFIDKLWRAVGVRLMTEMLEGLRSDRSYQIGDALIKDYGVEVTKRGFFSNSRVFGNWSELNIWSANGAFFIGMSSDKKAYSELSYIETDNTHIIEAAIRMKLKNNSVKLSSILS